MSLRTDFKLLAAVFAAGAIVAGCGGRNAGTMPTTAVPAQSAAAPAPDLTAPGLQPDTSGSILEQLTHLAVIGSTIDPSFGQLNPYGLTVARYRGSKVLDVRNVDTGAARSLVGMVATGSNAMDSKLYFNDHNDNNPQVLER